MSLDEQLRTALREETKEWQAPPELKEKILKQVVSKQGGRKMKKWLIASVLAAALLIPTGAYAAYSYIADSIYGSQDNIGATQQQYDRLEAKLQSAKESLSEEEFSKLMSLLKEIGSYNLQIADSEGVLHPERLDASEQVVYEKLKAELEPYFAKLNKGGSPSKAPSMVDIETFWNEQLAKAEESFSQEELEDFKGLVQILLSVNAKVVDPDGSVHPERLSVQEKVDAEQVPSKIEPYLTRLGLMTRPAEGSK